MLKLRHSHNENGFTIVELLVAISVLSVVLLVGTIILTNIGGLFSKGINQSQVQDNVRNTVDELSKRLELMSASQLPNTGPASGSSGYLCIDSTRYTYQIGRQVNNDPSAPQHALWRDTYTGGCAPADLSKADPSASTGGRQGAELLTSGERLTAFCVGTYDASTNTCSTTGSSPFTITLAAAFGDDDLLSAPPYSTQTSCKGSTGQQFCATATLTATIARRELSSAGGSATSGGPCTVYPDGFFPASSQGWVDPEDTSADAPFITPTEQNPYISGSKMLPTDINYPGYHGKVHVFTNLGASVFARQHTTTLYGVRICNVPPGTSCSASASLNPIGFSSWPDGADPYSTSRVQANDVQVVGNPVVQADQTCENSPGSGLTVQIWGNPVCNTSGSGNHNGLADIYPFSVNSVGIGWSIGGGRSRQTYVIQTFGNGPDYYTNFVQAKEC